MPQLDKYIFLHQMVSFTFFFFLLYMYSRKTIIPKLNGIMKFRKKMVKVLTFHASKLNKQHNSTHVYFSSKTVDSLTRLGDSIEGVITQLNNNLTANTNILINNLSEIKDNNKNLIKLFLFKDLKENHRNFYNIKK